MAKLELEIPDDIEVRMRHEADQEGVTVHTLAMRRVTAPYLPADKDTGSSPRNLFEYLGNFVGIVGDSSGRKDYAEKHSELFTEYLVAKQKEGNL